MAVTNVVKSGLEGFLYTNVASDATYTEGTGGSWVLLSYVTNFSYEENDGSRGIYDHYDIDHFKRGRSTNTGSISQLYTNKPASLLNLKGSTISLKLEIKDDGGSTVTEYHIFNKVRIGRVSFSQPDVEDSSCSCDFTYGTSTVDAP